MADPSQYTFDAHIRDADDMVVRHIANNPTLLHRVHAKARRDVRQRLKAHGYINQVSTERHRGNFNPLNLETQIHPAAEPANDFVAAVANVTITAATTGAITVASGTVLVDADPDDANETTVGSRRYTTNAELTVTAGNSGTVAVTAEHEGAAWNLPPGVALYLDAGAASEPDFSAAVVLLVTTEGVDHQLTRASTYRALSLLYLDLVKQADDAFDYKLRTYQREFEAEIAALVAAGIRMEVGTEDGVESIEEERLRHGFHRLHRG